MKRHTGILAGTLAAVALLAPATLATDIYVATTGNNGWPGTVSQPKRTIKGGIAAAGSGDVVRVRAGTYVESYIQVPSGVTVVSHDGPLAAKVNANGGTSFRFENGVSDAEVDGFEVWSIYGGGPSATDGLVRAWNCSDIRIRNLKVYDAPRDGDCIKIGGSGSLTTNILIENCEVFSPSPRDGSGYQECIDLFPVDNVTIRNCWLYHTAARGGDVLTFCKGGCTNITWENNVFGPAYSDPNGNPSTMAGGPSPAVYPACTDFVARNNLFLECSGDGAFGLVGVRNCEFYNNVIWGYKGNRAAIEFWTALVGGPRNENFQFYNNIVMNQTRPVFSDRGYAPVVLGRDYNIYYQTGGGGSLNLASEANSQVNVNPLLTSPASPVPGTDTRGTIVADFLLQRLSPAVNTGRDLAALGVTTDIRGDSRPVGVVYDIGAHEYALPGDLDRDGSVNVFDVFVIAEHWNTQAGYDAAADADGDGSVDIFDIFVVAENWNQTL